MRVAYYVDSSNAVNWGGQATSAGIRHLVETTYPDAEFCPLNFGKLPFRHVTFLRRFAELAVFWAVLNKKIGLLKRLLAWYGINPALYDQYDVVCFNGEGAIHERSGHFFRLLGSLYAFKCSGARVYSLNQTVDVTGSGRHARLLKAVYPVLDRIAVREPTSLRLMNRLGIECELIGDAAYALPLMTQEEIQERLAHYDLPLDFIGVTASSAMDRNQRSVDKMARLLGILQEAGRPVVFLANTKTDLYIANRLASQYVIQIIDYKDADYLDAIAIIASASLLIGGRQHPNIFAAKYNVPFIGLAGNTHKMSGVAELLNYPVPVFAWDFDESVMRQTLDDISSGRYDFSMVRVPKLTSIDLG